VIVAIGSDVRHARAAMAEVRRHREAGS